MLENLESPTPIVASLPIEIKKPPKKEVHIREVDNGYVLTVYAGAFREEWAFLKLSKAIKAIIAFLNTEMEDEK
jgi:hypothetical protein